MATLARTRNLFLVALLVGAVSVSACSKKKEKTEAAAPAAESVPRPPGLLSVVTIPALKAFLTAVKGMAAAIEPAAAAMISEEGFRMMLGQLVAGVDVSKLDLGKPIHLFVFDPKSEARPFALLARTTAALPKPAAGDELQIASRDGWSLVGGTKIVAAVSDFAFSGIAHPAPAVDPVARVFVDEVVERYRAFLTQLPQMFEAEMAQSPEAGKVAKILKLEIEMLLALAEQTDRLDVVLAVAGETAHLKLALVPKKGSGMAKFIAIQKPDDFAMLKKLAPGEPQIAMAGAMHAGELAEPLRELSLKMVRDLAGRELDEKLRNAATAWVDVFTGEFAVTMAIGEGGMKLQEIIGVTDQASAEKAFASIMDLMSLFSGTGSLPGMKIEADYRPAAFKHDGIDVSVSEMKFDLSDMPEASRAAIVMMYGDAFVGQFAAVDKEMMVVFGDKSREQIGKLIDAVRGKGPTMEQPPALGAALAEARAQRESAVMVMDLASFVRTTAATATGTAPKAGPSTSSLRMGVAFADGNATLRFTIDTAFIREVKSMGQ